MSAGRLVPSSSDVRPARKTIWMWWHAGEADLSPFLQACLQSWRVHHPGWDVVVLSIENLWQYLDPTDLPSTFSSIGRRSLQCDLVRLAVLAKHGGCCVDISVLALTGCAEAAWRLLHDEGRCLVGYRAPHFISDFVCVWFLVAKAREPLVAEWSRALNGVMEGRTDDRDVHLEPFFEGVDLAEYHHQCRVDASSPSKCWADYLVVNVVLKALLDRDALARAAFWATAALAPERDPRAGPTLWSEATQAPRGLGFPENERYKMEALLELQDALLARLQRLPMLKFFDCARPYGKLSLAELLAAPSVIGRLVQQALFPQAADLQLQRPSLHPKTSRQQRRQRRRQQQESQEKGEGEQFGVVSQDISARVVVATLATSDFYAVGAACLARSLRQHGRLRPETGLVCLVPRADDVGHSGMRGRLEAEGWQVLPVEGFTHEAYPFLFEDLENPGYRHCFLKLHLWDLERLLGRPLDRVLYVDSDAVAVGSLGEALYSAAMAPPARGVSMSPDYDWRTGWPASELSAVSGAASHAAAAAFKPEAYCNAGVLLLRPGAAEHRRLLGMLRNFRHRGLAEQDLLHDAFTAQGRTKVLHQGYNAQKWIRICAPQLWETYDLRIIHFNNHKPWELRHDGSVRASFAQENAQCPDLVKLWHDLYSWVPEPPEAAVAPKEVPAELAAPISRPLNHRLRGRDRRVWPSEGGGAGGRRGGHERSRAAA